MEEETIKVIKITVTGVLSWFLIFFLTRRIFSNYSFDFSNRLVSSLHATVAVVLATLSIQDWSCPVCPAPTSSLQQMETLAFSLSYMIYDLICCQFDKKGVSVDNALHHLVCIFGFGAGLSYRKGGSEMVAALLITEITSPLLHLREILKEIGYRDTDLNLAADASFAILFSLARMVAGPYILYVTLSTDNPIFIKAMASGLQLVSAFWFYKIVKMMKYKLIKRSASHKKYK